MSKFSALEALRPPSEPCPPRRGRRTAAATDGDDIDDDDWVSSATLKDENPLLSRAVDDEVDVLCFFIPLSLGESVELLAVWFPSDGGGEDDDPISLKALARSLSESEAARCEVRSGPRRIISVEGVEVA